MATPGFIYGLSNSAMPGLCKVGKTTRDPKERARELSSATGVPAGFQLVYYEPVGDCDVAEAWIHGELERSGARLNNNREFFRAELHEVVRLISQAKTAIAPFEADVVLPVEDSDGSDRTPAEELYELGMTYLDGSDSVLVNERRAVELFEQAAAMGDGSAAFVAADLYRYGEGNLPQDLEKALRLYHLSLRNGGPWHIPGAIASVLVKAGQIKASETQWKAFFEAALTYCERLPNDRVAETDRYFISIYGADYFVLLAARLVDSVVNVEQIARFSEWIDAELPRAAKTLTFRQQFSEPDDFYVVEARKLLWRDGSLSWLGRLFGK